MKHIALILALFLGVALAPIRASADYKPGTYIYGATSGTITLAAPATVTPYTLTLPAAVPSQGSLLTFTNGTGTIGTIAAVSAGQLFESAGTATVAGYESQVTLSSTGSLLQNAGDTITSDPTAASTATGWKDVYSSTLYGRGIATLTIYDKSPQWWALGNADPNNDATTGAPDSNSTFAINTVTGELSFGTWIGNVITAPFGGTGLSTFAIGDLIYASTTTVLSRLADPALGQLIISKGTSTAPAWSASPYLSGSLRISPTSTAAAGTASGAVLVESNTANQGVAWFTTAASATNGPFIYMRSAQGSIGSETATAANEGLGRIYFTGYGTSAYGTASNSANIAGQATELWSNTAHGSQFRIWTVPNTTIIPTLALIIDQDQSATFSGNVSLGANSITAGNWAGTIIPNTKGGTGASNAGTSGHLLIGSGSSTYLDQAMSGSSTITSAGVVASDHYFYFGTASGQFSTAACTAESTCDYMVPFSTATSANLTNTENRSQVPVPVTGTFKNLTCKTSVASGTGMTDIIKMRKAAADPSGNITVTISNSAAAVTDSTHSVAVTAGDLVDFEDILTGTNTAHSLHCVYDYVY